MLKTDLQHIYKMQRYIMRAKQVNTGPAMLLRLCNSYNPFFSLLLSNGFKTCLCLLFKVFALHNYCC